MFSVKTSSSFTKAIKRLSKKYPNAPKDVLRIVDSLESGNFIGDAIPGFSQRVYKVRIPSSDQKRGKRGGFRLVYYVVMENRTIYLLTIYAKPKQGNVDPSLIRKIVDDLYT